MLGFPGFRWIVSNCGVISLSWPGSTLTKRLSQIWNRPLHLLQKYGARPEKLLAAMGSTTVALVMASMYTLVLMRDYRKFFSGPSYTPELEAYISFKDMIVGLNNDGLQDCPMKQHPWGNDRRHPCSLSVEGGLALLVGQVPLLIDFSDFPTQPQDIYFAVLDLNSHLTRDPSEWGAPLYRQGEACAVIAKGSNQMFALHSNTKSGTVIDHWDFDIPLGEFVVPDNAQAVSSS